MNIIHNRKYACDFLDILNSIICFDSPSTELLLFNYAKVNSFPFYGTFTANRLTSQLVD